MMLIINGQLLDWHERKQKTIFKDLMVHPGIEAIQSTLAYFRLHEIKTKVIGSGFRSVGP
jgi:transaldolase